MQEQTNRPTIKKKNFRTNDDVETDIMCDKLTDGHKARQQ